MLGEYCAEILQHNHETFYCGNSVHEDDVPHSNVTGAWPPCKRCFGIDSHSKGCPDHTVLAKSITPCRVEWFTGQKPKIRREP